MFTNLSLMSFPYLLARCALMFYFDNLRFLIRLKLSWFGSRDVLDEVF